MATTDAIPGTDASSATDAVASPDAAVATDAAPIDAGPAASALSLDFDGADDEATCGSAPALDALTDVYTIEAWFYWDGDLGALLSKLSDPATENTGWQVRVSELNPAPFQPGIELYHGGGISGPGSGAGGFGIPFVPSIGWHHFGWSISPGCAYYVMDGAVPPGFGPGCTVAGAYALISSSAPLILGAPGPFVAMITPPDRYDGRLDEVRIWSVLRTDVEMLADMYVELSGTEPGLVLYLSFEDGPADVTFDTSPSGVSCTLGAVAGADAADPAWSSDAPF